MRSMARSVVFVACATGTLGLDCGGSWSYCQCGTRAITVRVIDGVTGEPVTSATVTASDGVNVETLNLYGGAGAPCVVPFADYSGVQRAGLYTLQVEADGYESVVIENFYVPQDAPEGSGCGYTPVDWLVELRAAS